MTDIFSVFFYEVKHWLCTYHCSARNQWYDDQKLYHNFRKPTDAYFIMINYIEIPCTIGSKQM